jgi:hypothetical protein
MYELVLGYAISSKSTYSPRSDEFAVYNGLNQGVVSPNTILVLL